jgi:cell division protein FtsZ
VVTRPFSREGKHRSHRAEEGIRALRETVDSLIVIPNDRLLGLAGKNMSILDAFKPADDVLRQAVQGISDLIITSGMINVDFADVKTVMSNRGMAMMGIGEASGERRASEAAQRAISSPLLEDIDISGARGVLVNISASSTMTMEEFDEASRIIHEKVHEDANIITGLVINEELGDVLKITCIATGFGDSQDKKTSVSDELRTPAMMAVGGIKSDRDVPTFIRKRQLDKPVTRDIYGDEQEYDIPTFLRKRVD